MATMATAARDVHATSPRDTFTGVAARSVPVTKSLPHTLPTPPNSISPALPPHGLRAQLQRARLDPIDSDLDLHDGAHAAGAPRPGSPPYESSGAISPSMLAKHHLPEILLSHGPLAIRHVMGYLTTSVPGFAGIPPAKARRLVVGALEGRSGANGSAGGGPNGDVIFEKVGWGRWDARRRGQPPRATTSSPPPEGMVGIPISAVRGAPGRWNGGGTSSVGGMSGCAFSHDDEYGMEDRYASMMENEADKMSMDDDGSASASCSEAPDDVDMAMHNDDPEDVTDDEDWAAVGAAALRAASYSNQGNLQAVSGSAPHAPAASRVYNGAGGVGAGLRTGSYNAGMARAPQPPRGFDFAAMGATASDAQEREAVEALLSLGSL